MSEDDPDAIARETAEFESMAKALVGLLDGNLAPLAAHLRNGFPVESILSAELANLIDGEGDDLRDFQLILKGRDHRRLPFSEQRRIHMQKMELGYFVHELKTRAPGGEHEAIIAEAVTKFADRGVKGKTVEAAYTYFRKYLRGDFQGHWLFDIGEEMEEIEAKSDGGLGSNDNA